MKSCNYLSSQNSLCANLKAWLKMRLKRIEEKSSAMASISSDIRFRFDTLKTIQVAATFLRLRGGSMNYLGLLKLLYIADRFALQKINQPLTGDIYVSMKYGPVLTTVYDLIKGEVKHKNAIEQPDKRMKALTLWEKYIGKTKKDLTINNQKNIDEDYEVRLVVDPGNGELSEEEEDIILKIHEIWKNTPPFTLAELTHLFPEWTNPLELDPPEKVWPIDNRELLGYLGKNQEEIAQLQEILAREAYFDTIRDDDAD